MQSHKADILQQKSIRRDLLDVASSKTDYEQSAVPGDALGGLGNEPNGVVHDVDAAALGCEFLHFLWPVLFPVVDAEVCAEAACDVQLVLPAGSCDDGCAEGFGDLDSSQTDTTCRCVDEDPVACIESVFSQPVFMKRPILPFFTPALVTRPA
jgi:hypothetical protein